MVVYVPLEPLDPRSGSFMPQVDSTMLGRLDSLVLHAGYSRDGGPSIRRWNPWTQGQHEENQAYEHESTSLPSTLAPR